jgi:hypothetical protein
MMRNEAYISLSLRQMCPLLEQEAEGEVQPWYYVESRSRRDEMELQLRQVGRRYMLKSFNALPIRRNKEGSMLTRLCKRLHGPSTSVSSTPSRVVQLPTPSHCRKPNDVVGNASPVTTTAGIVHTSAALELAISFPMSVVC